MMGGRRAIRALRGALPESGVVHDMTAEGQGIIDVAGKRVFVAGAITGESVTFQRLHWRRNYDEAKLLEVAAPSADRAVPRCRYFGTCGGCSLQHLTGAAQLHLKQAVLADNLQRIGQVSPAQWLAPVTGPPWGYRRRARLSVRDVAGKGRVLVGFSERGSPYVADMLGCETLHPQVARLIAPLSELIGRLSLRRQIPQVEAAVADNATVLVLRVLATPSAADLDQLRAFRDQHHIRVLLQHSSPAAVVGLDPAVDEGELWYELPASRLRMGFGPTDFIQVNAGVNQQMIGLATALLEVTPAMRILDLYCGIGNFTLPLALQSAHVLGLEGEARAVARARSNAVLNGVGNAEFRCVDLGSADGAMAWVGRRFDAALLDPPRAGAAAMLRPVADSGARRIVYVSCHPGTLARDAGVLVNELGYRLLTAGVLDMFPATSHVESLALFERR
jgi:23S rRNA (uracil1939-C5)-methyltransferase